MDNELQIIGPKSAGLLGQFWSLGWKFYSKRFGPFGGEAFQSQRHVTDKLRKEVIRVGTKFRRKLEGKNGWLWWTVFRKMGEIKKLEMDRDTNYMKLPDPYRWYHKIVLKIIFGYTRPWTYE